MKKKILSAITAISVVSSMCVIPTDAKIELIPGDPNAPFYKPVNLSYNVKNVFCEENVPSTGGNIHGSNGYICADIFREQDIWDEAWEDGMTENTLTANGVKFKMKVQSGGGAAAAFMSDISTTAENKWAKVDMEDMKYTSVDILGYFALSGLQYSTTTVRLNYTEGESEIVELGNVAHITNDPTVKYANGTYTPNEYMYGNLAMTVRIGNNSTALAKTRAGYFSHFRIPADSTRVLDNIEILGWRYDLNADGTYKSVATSNVTKATNIHAITGITTVAEENAKLETLRQVLTLSGGFYRYDADTVCFEGEFLNPVNEDTLEGTIAVTVNGKAVTEGVSYKLADDDMTLTVDIPAGMNGGDVVKISVGNAVKLLDYPEIGMEEPFEKEWTTNVYITAEYDGAELTIKSNAKVGQPYLAIAGKYTAETETAFAEEGTVDTKDVLLMDASGAEGTAYAVVADKATYKPLAVSGKVKETTAVTDKTADYKKATLDLSASTVKLHGITKTAEKDKVIIVTIYNPAGAKLLYAGAVKTNADGYFVINAPIAIEDVGTSGYLKINLGGDDFAEIVTIDDVYYPLKADQIQIVKDIKNAADTDAVKKLLADAVNPLSINLAPYLELVNDTDGDDIDNLAEFAARVESIKATLPEIADGDSEEVKNEKIVTTQNILKVQAILECIEKGKEALVSANGLLSYDDVMKYSSIDADGITLYELYQDEVSEDGKKAVVASLLNKDYANEAALYDDLKKAIMLNALKNPAQSGGVGYVKKALTEKNAAAVGMDITKYLALEDTTTADGDIANMTISSLDDVEGYISGLEQETTPLGKPASKPSVGKDSFVATTPITPVVSPVVQESFSDVKATHWAYEAIENLFKRGIINGKGNGTFRPDDTITRAEFVKILCLAKNIQPSYAESIFSDVASNAWYAPYVMAAADAGIISGVDKTHFAPTADISRQDICTVLYRMDNTEFAEAAVFADSAAISEYAVSAVAYGFSSGFISGFPDNTFRPKASCTRAQAATIIYKYLNDGI